MEENQDFAALRDASIFIQLHAEGELFRELLQSIRRNVSDCRRSVWCHLTDVLRSYLLLLQSTKI
jgi:hypothetical protein